MVYVFLENMMERVDGFIDDVMERLGIDSGLAEVAIKLGYRAMMIIGFLAFLSTGNPIMLLAPLMYIASMFTVFLLLILFVEWFVATLRVIATFIDSAIDVLIMSGRL